jgi:hypothetical protein
MVSSGVAAVEWGVGNWLPRINRGVDHLDGGLQIVQTIVQVGRVVW